MLIGSRQLFLTTWCMVAPFSDALPVPAATMLCIIVAVATVSPCLPFGSSGPCGQCRMEHAAYGVHNRAQVVQRGLVRLHSRMPHRLWLPASYIEQELSCLGANACPEYGWKKGDIKDFTKKMKKLGRKTSNEYLTQFHVFRESSTQGDKNRDRNDWWYLWSCPDAEKHPPLLTISEQTELVERLNSVPVLHQYAHAKGFAQLDSNGISKVPGWKAFVTAAAAEWPAFVDAKCTGIGIKFYALRFSLQT